MMRLLEIRPGDSSETRRILLFGMGLIGSALDCVLKSRGCRHLADWAFDWTDHDQQDEALQRITDGDDLGSSSGFELVWCAGSAGFAADESATAGELETFRRVVEFAARQSSDHPVGFHLVSSAGGLYEGAVCVSAETPVAPRRPYGHLKLAQEEMLQASSEQHPGLRTRVYRPSSVMGPYRPGMRSGLLTTLLMNGVRNRVTSIWGGPSTQRDFVWVGDVANFVADSVLERAPAAGAPPAILASARPSTLLEVITHVERCLNKRLLLEYSRADSNASKITFSSRAVAAGFFCTPLEQCVRLTLASMLGRGFGREGQPG